jgi:Protein of unknown function (DUF3500)
MNTKKGLGAGFALAIGIAGGLWLTPGEAARGGQDEASSAANAFLRSLPADLRGTAQFTLNAPERFDWNFVPKARVGVSLLKLDDTQSELLGPLLASALSPEGLLSARGVIKHENILRRVETESGLDAARRDPGLYFTTIFGKPGAAAPWAWRFEGHHLSLNVTQLPGQAPRVGPLFMGANPATVPTGPQTGYRLLADEEDLGRALIRMLPEERRRQALIRDTAFAEILTNNHREVQLELAGVAAADLSADERQQLRALVELYVGRLVKPSATEVLARLERAGFDQLRFAWAGGTEPGQPHYYRVHGPTLLIEYDNTQNEANHIHTVYRDLQFDFGGGDVLRAHYQGASR